MTYSTLSLSRVKGILRSASKARLLIVGDVMLDHFIWGTVTRISPEAPVPVVEFSCENFMPGGAANVARNLASLSASTQLIGAIGKDEAGEKLQTILQEQKIGCTGLVQNPSRHTSIKTRIVAHQQQVVRLDRETRGELDAKMFEKLLGAFKKQILSADAVLLGDYGKGVVTQALLEEIKQLCRKHKVWLSLDPKPVHRLDLAGLSLITPNRKEAFALADVPDTTGTPNPLADKNLLRVADKLLKDLQPTVLLITLGELGMLLCQSNKPPTHIPTVAQEVFDVSGAGDTVIATFTLAIATGASPVEAAIFSNHAAGIVVGKVGTATVTPEELLANFAGDKTPRLK